ncbi:GNAT family N-acetyltransferase [Leadbetterella byssophila]|uniref:GNAT family N-acetyltransferase n=1 Tax=Leadbetterella byssophila TaxID=316068 RepID=UPI0039A0B7DD
MKKLDFKTLDSSHSASITDMILSIQQKEFGIPITIDDQPDLSDIETFYLRGGGCFLGAFLNGDLVGTIALIKFSSSSGAIRKMFVKKEFRGKEWGIAQKLLERLFQFCRAEGISNLYLGTVSVLKAAQRFYERNHFRRLQKEELPSDFPLMSSDDVFYGLKLGSAIEEVGFLALSTRLQRLSERIRRDGALIYKAFGRNFDPKWFPVVLSLDRKGELSISELAEEIGYSHPSTIVLLKELQEKGYVSSKKDILDERKRLNFLTENGKQLIKELKPIWEIMNTVLEEIGSNSHHLLRAIEQAEDKLEVQTFYQRVLAVKRQ